MALKVTGPVDYKIGNDFLHVSIHLSVSGWARHLKHPTTAADTPSPPFLLLSMTCYSAHGERHGHGLHRCAEKEKSNHSTRQDFPKHTAVLRLVPVPPPMLAGQQ